MFEPPPGPRTRPMLTVSAAAHAALAVALVVPPLFATPEPPEPDGIVRIEHFPRLASDPPARVTVNFSSNEKKGRPPVVPERTRSAAPRPQRPSQPTEIGSVLPEATGDAEDPFTSKENISGERSEPLLGGNGSGGGTGEGEGGGCEGCDVISANAPGVTPPVALETPSPAYPELARRVRVEGVILLEAIIASDGTVRDVRVLRSAHALLAPAALEAVRSWRYRPASIRGRPVAVFLNVVVTFALR